MLSRVADSLYWMSRYLERAEHTARLVDVDLHGLIDQDPDNSRKRHTRLLETLEFELTSEPSYRISQHFIEHIALDKNHENSIVSSIAKARENARHVREEISSEMWEQLNKMYLYITQSDKVLINENPHLFLSEIKSRSLLFQGITDSTLSHSEGWHFIHIGRYLERVSCILQLLKVFYAHFPIGDDDELGSKDYYDWIGLMKSCTAYEAYCRVYRSFLSPPRMSSFLILDPDFPHSVRFSINFMKQSLDEVAELTQTRKVGNTNRLIGKMSASLDYASIEEIKENPVIFLNNIQRQIHLLHDSINTTYISYPVETGL